MSTSEGHRVATSSQTVGPFFRVGLTGTDRLGEVATPKHPGEHIRFTVRVIDGAGTPVPDAMVELWQADAGGSWTSAPTFRGFGRLGTDAGGACTFATVRPGPAVDCDGTTTAAHINFCVFMRGLLRHVYTRAYFEGDPGLATDAVLQHVPASRRNSLVASLVPGSLSDWVFEIHLQGDRETVFFDL